MHCPDLPHRFGVDEASKDMRSLHRSETSSELRIRVCKSMFSGYLLY